MHPSGRAYVSRHVNFNPEEFPFPHLFSSIHTPQSEYSMGLPTTILNSFPFSVKSGHSPQVAPIDSLVSSATHSISSVTNSSSIVPEQSPYVPVESAPLSLHV